MDKEAKHPVPGDSQESVLMDAQSLEAVLDQVIRA